MRMTARWFLIPDCPQVRRVSALRRQPGMISIV